MQTRFEARPKVAVIDELQHAEFPQQGALLRVSVGERVQGSGRPPGGTPAVHGTAGQRFQRGLWRGLGQPLRERAVEKQREHAERDMGSYLAVGAMAYWTQFYGALDHVEVHFDSLLGAIQRAELLRSMWKIGVAYQNSEAIVSVPASPIIRIESHRELWSSCGCILTDCNRESSQQVLAGQPVFNASAQSIGS